MSESLILNLFVFLFVLRSSGHENDCFRVCLIFHFINPLFALSESSISWNFSVTSVVVVVS